MALLKYTLLRLGLLAATAGVLHLIGVRGWFLLLLAFLVSGLLALVLLNRARDEVSTTLSNRRETINRRLEVPDSEDEAGSQADR